MKKKLFAIVLAFSLAASLASAVVAQTGIPGSGWWTGEQIQNVGTATATIVVTAYDKNGALTYTTSQTATVGSTIGLIPSNFPGMPAGFIGSAVVSSDQPIKAVVNVANVPSSPYGIAGGKAQALYQGTEVVDTKLYFPMVKNNRFSKSTAFYIQNAGSTAASVTAVYKMDTGGTYTHTVASVEPNKMVLINPSDAGVPTTGGAGGRDNIGSLTVSSAQPLAGTVFEYTNNENPATVLAGTRGFTAADFDTKAYAPIIKNARFGRFTGIQVQNASAGPIDVTIRYIGSAGVCAGSVYTDTASGIAAGASRTFNQTTGQTTLPSDCAASATVIATGNFIATVNESTTSSPPTAAITYSAIPDKAATTKVSVPQFKDRRFGATSGLQIQNVGGATATNIVSTFSCRGGATFTAVSVARSAASGGSIQWYQPFSNPALFSTPFSSMNVVCGVTITADQPIVAINNETATTAGAFDDNNYEGFNLAP
jgi:hypothetical protein